MSWAEMGVTYGKVTANEQHKYMKGEPVTFNYAIPIDGMYINIKNLSYKTTDTSGTVQNIDATFAHATSSNGQASMSDLFAKRGWGLGTNIGMTLIERPFRIQTYSLKRAADNLQKYKYRFGVSLIDFGFARFNSNDADVVDLYKNGGSSVNNLNNMPFGNLSISLTPRL